MRIGWIAIFGWIFASCGPDVGPEIEAEFASLPDQIDYNFHVKPILSDRCFLCHGPDAQTREGGLRLDEEEGARATLESGAGKAIVSGSPNKSQLVHRILTEDSEAVMPPPESNLSLTAHEKAILIRWIEQGAEYKPHWAFIKPEPQPVPEIASDWARNEIDRFIVDRLDQIDVLPSPEAERPQLIRRLFFDLTGLPPTLQELDLWMNDTRPDYYEQLVDSLLASPRYGERMTAHWLDVARFADSEGYLDDFHHTFWPYRDWVINAFNKNLPYDNFIEWQVGGDQIPNATEEQVLATSFNRNHKQNSEGGIIPEEFRVEYVADRTNTVGAAFLGLTFGCARCHDHKYDPISQEDYFELFGFFNSTVERGDGIFSQNAIEKGNMVPNYYSMNAGPVLALPDKEVADIRDFLLEEISREEVTMQTMAEENQSTYLDWSANVEAALLEDLVAEATVTDLKFDQMKDGLDTDAVRGNDRPSYWGDIRTDAGVHGNAVVSAASGQYVADGSASTFERSEPFTISFWINVPRFYETAHVIYNGNNRIQGYRGWDVKLDSNRIHFRLNHAHPYQSIDLRIPEPLDTSTWTHFVWTYDGSSTADGMKIYQNGVIQDVDVQRNYLYRSTVPYPDLEGSVYMKYKGIIIGNRHYDQDFEGGKLDDVKILNREGGQLVANLLHDLEKGREGFRKAIVSGDPALKEFYDLWIDSGLADQRSKLRDMRTREVHTIDTVQEIMVMGDFEKEQPTYILERGVYDAHGKRVERNVPESILPWPEDLPKNRLGLGKWMTHPDNPLTSRVVVNQIWYLMFGRGIVETVEDLGNQGALPTHPELLDWLAIDFVEHGWDLKRLIKQMVTSSTYRQSSIIRQDLQEIDPDNKLLARGPRYRRSAEMIRDNVLAVSDLLSNEMGGPSSFPYQPPGLWKEVMTHGFFPEYEVNYEKGLHRRSIYTFWKRNMPPPSMLIFDASSRAECEVRRKRSSTPLQALVLLNDPQILEACRVLSENVWKKHLDDETAMHRDIFRSLTSRVPNEKELGFLQQQYQEELSYFEEHPERALAFLNMGKYQIEKESPPSKIAALSRVANTILNTTESYYKN